MSPTDPTAVNPRDGDATKAGTMEDTAKPYRVNEPETGPEVSPGPDTSEEPDSPN